MIFAYKEVSNGSAILESVASMDPRIVVIDLALVVSSFHLQLATYKALLNESQDKMKTKSIQSEVLYQLSTSTKITDALQQYSVHAGSTDIAFVYVAPANETETDSALTADDFKQLVEGLGVQGHQIDPEEISTATILTPEKSAKIAKYFKITPQELEVSGLEESVATRLAVKDSL